MKIQLQLSSGGTHISESEVACEECPKIGDILDFTGSRSTKFKDQHERMTFLVTWIDHRWRDGGLRPFVEAEGIDVPQDLERRLELLDVRSRIGVDPDSKHSGEVPWPWRC